ncbi:MAG: MOSC domain-containing protein [Verrucomicrobiales bacterium]
MQIHHIYVSPGHNFYGHHGMPPDSHQMLEVDQVECVAGKGLAGDRFFDYKPDYKGQVTFFSMEVHEALQQRFGKTYSPSCYRRNVIVSEVDLNALIGKEFEVGGLRFLGSCEAAPCYWMDQAIAEGAEEAMKGSGGLRAKILSDGTLRRSSAAVVS